MKTHIQNLVLTLLLLTGIHQSAAQQTTAFTYQGQLRDGSTNANGSYSLTFKLYNAASGGAQIGGTLTAPNQSIVNGLFTVALDFGGAAFDGNARWLETTVQAGASAAETLAPRVAVLPAPYALFAKVAGTVTNGAIMNAQLAASAIATANIQNGAITTALIANGAVTNQNLTANAVATANIRDNAITQPKVAMDAVATINIQDTAVTTAKIQDLAVTDAKILSVSGVKVSSTVASAAFAIAVADGSIGTASLQAGAVTGAKIASGQVVRSLNLLTDAVSLSAGQNVSLTTVGNDIQISTITNSTVIGPWTVSASTLNGIPNMLVFSSGGVPRMAVAPQGQGVVVFDKLSVNEGASQGGDVTVKGSINVNGSVSVSNGIAASFVAATGNMTALAFLTTSDRHAKENFKTIDSKEVLERVASLPISSWNFKTAPATRHIGPMAQDFHAAFKLGTDDKHIALVDEGGVALAAIQGLHSIVKEKDAEITDLKKRLETLERIVLKQNGGGQ